MNKRILTVAVAALALAACSKNETVEVADSNLIGFESAFVGNPTRAVTEIDNETIDHFMAYGAYGESNQIWENGQEVAPNANGEWTYSPLVPWENEQTYKFAAYAPKTLTVTPTFDYATGTLSFQDVVVNNESNQVDFVYDENKFNDTIEIYIKYLKRLDTLLEESDDDFEVYKERGDLRAKLGFYNDAIDDYKKSLELNSNYKEADKALTDTKNNLDIYNNSLINKDYTKDPMYYFSKAHNLYNKRKYEEAIKNYNKSIDLDPNNSYAYNNRGLTKNNLEQYFDAVKDYDKAIELEPNNSVIYYNRGLAKTHLWQYEEAIEDYNKAIELDNNNSTAYYNRGLVKSYLGQYKEAIEDYNKTIELDPNNSHAYNNRGNAKDDLGRYKEAIKDYDKAIELNPNDRAAYHNRGLVKNYLRQYEEAMKDYDKAIELVPNNTDVYNYNYYNRGVIKRSLGQCDKTIKNFYKGIELNPNFSPFYK